MTATGPYHCAASGCACVMTMPAVWVRGLPFCACCAADALERAVLPPVGLTQPHDVDLKETTP